jgi:ribosomal-protein-alanine N-acetyltransferase
MLKMEQACPTAAHWTEAQYRLAIDSAGDAPRRLTLVAAELSSSGILGFLVAHDMCSEWELENIVVAAAARRKGLGRELLAALLDRARPMNGRKVFLEVRESNVAARNLYRKIGFHESGRRKLYYAEPPEDAILYTYNFD